MKPPDSLCNVTLQAQLPRKKDQKGNFGILSEWVPLIQIQNVVRSISGMLTDANFLDAVFSKWAQPGLFLFNFVLSSIQ